MKVFLFVIVLVLMGFYSNAQEKSLFYNEKGQLLIDTSYNVTLKNLKQIIEIEKQLIPQILDNVVYPKIVVENYISSKVIALITINKNKEIRIKKFICSDTITSEKIQGSKYKSLKYDLDPYVNKELKQVLENKVKITDTNIQYEIEIHLPFEFLMTEDKKEKKFINGRFIFEEIIEYLDYDGSAVESSGVVSSPK